MSVHGHQGQRVCHDLQTARDPRSVKPERGRAGAGVRGGAGPGRGGRPGAPRRPPARCASRRPDGPGRRPVAARARRTASSPGPVPWFARPRPPGRPRAPSAPRRRCACRAVRARPAPVRPRGPVRPVHVPPAPVRPAFARPRSALGGWPGRLAGRVRAAPGRPRTRRGSLAAGARRDRSRSRPARPGGPGTPAASSDATAGSVTAALKVAVTSSCSARARRAGPRPPAPAGSASAIRSRRAWDSSRSLRPSSERPASRRSSPSAVSLDGTSGSVRTSRLTTHAERVGLRRPVIARAAAPSPDARAWAASAPRRWINPAGSPAYSSAAASRASPASPASPAWSAATPLSFPARRDSK